MKRELTAALKAAGSGRALAALLGVSPSTIYRWKRDGVPKRGEAREKLAAYKAERKRAKQLQREERQTFELLMKEAGELERLPKGRTQTRKREGPRTDGMRFTLGINRMLTAAVLERVRLWGQSIRGRRPVWQGQAITTQYALPTVQGEPGSFRGYQTVGSIEQMSTPGAGDFAVGLVNATPRRGSRSAALKALLELLQDIAGDGTLIAYIHSVTLFNYTIRSEQERKQWQTKQRQSRRKSWEKRQRSRSKQTPATPKGRKKTRLTRKKR